MGKFHIQISRFILFLSFLFIFTGIFLSFSNDKSLQDPILNVTVVSKGTDSSISINTTDRPKVSSDDSVFPSNSSDIVSENNSLRNRIQSTYSVLVRYGSETDQYRVGGLNTIAITDPVQIHTALVNLDHCMSLYPTGFFQEIESAGFHLIIYLIQKYSSDNVTGVTDSSSKNIRLSIATEYPFDESFHHEVYHYIDDFIYEKGGRYTTWNSLNPADFYYGSVNANYSYSKSLSENAFFVNDYAQTDEYEDRASTFEFMMADSKASCLNYGSNVWLKAKFMSEQMDLYFTTVSSDTLEYWERFVD